MRQNTHHRGMDKESAAPAPKPFVKPANWTNEPPPRPEPVKDNEALSPTRYGDWVRNGVAVDF